MRSIVRSVCALLCALAFFLPANTFGSVVEADLPGHSLYLHIKGFAAPFPGPGNYTIDFTATGHNYSIMATGAVTSASGTWSFRQGELFDTVVITLNNYFGNGTGAEILLRNDAYYELYAGSSNQNGNWSLKTFVQDPVFERELPDQTSPEGGYVSFVPSLLNGSSGVAFQWFKNGQPLAGEIKASLTILGLTKAAEGLYSVQVSKGSDTNVSRQARLTVVTPQPASFAGHGFEMVLTNNTPPPEFPAAPAPNAIRLKGATQAVYKDGQLTFIAEYTGAGTNNSKKGVGLYSLANGVLKKLVSSVDFYPGTSSPYTAIPGFSEPVDGKFLFYGVGNNGGSVNAGILAWDGTAVAKVVEKGAVIPGTEGLQFQFFGVPGGPGLEAVFSGYGPGQAAGYYQFKAGSIVELFDNNSALPGFPAPPYNYDMTIPAAGAGPVRTFVLRERNTGAFRAITRNDDGTVATLFAKGDFYPGTTIPMTQYGGTGPKTRNGLTAFLLGDDVGGSFLISADAQGLHAVAKTGDTIPGTSAKITGISNFGVTDAGIVFGATTEDSRTGVYLSQAGGLSVVINTLNRIGTNVVTGAGLATAYGTNLVIQAGLYPAGGTGLMINTAAPEIVVTQPRISIVSSRVNAENHFALTLSVEAVAAVALEHSTDFTGWTSLTTNTVTGAETTLVDPRVRGGGGTRDFYRVRQAAP